MKILVIINEDIWFGECVNVNIELYIDKKKKSILIDILEITEGKYINNHHFRNESVSKRLAKYWTI